MRAKTSMMNWLFFVLLGLLPVAASSEQEPKFTTEFPLIFDFSNITGGKLSCKAQGEPQPNITWLTIDGSPVTHVSKLRQILPDGTLFFPSFGIDDFRQDVHGVSYRCAATNILGTIVSNEIKVKGVVNQNFDIHVYDVYTMKRNSAIMRCHIPKFLETYVNVTAWIKDSVISITTSDFSANSKYILMPTGELIIKDVDGNDALTIYRCQVLNRLTGETKLSNPGRLIVTESDGKVPPKIIFGKSNLVVAKNEKLFLPCITNGNPTPIYTWIKESTSGLREDINANDDGILITNGLLIIEKVQEIHNGRYICTASNEVNSVILTIQVTVVEPLTARIIPSKMTVDANQEASITCKISGSPVQSITWLKNGKELQRNDFSQITNDTIKISNMANQHVGIYQCFVINEFYSTFDSTLIQLGDSMPVIVKDFDSQILNPRNTILLECTAQGNPIPQFEWSLDNTKLISNGRININMRSDGSNVVTSILEISNIKVEDGGVYRCIAKTKRGFVEHSKRIFVHGKLGVRSNVKYQAIEDGDVQLDCPVYGYPMNKIQWEKDGRSMPIHIRHSVPKNGSLLIENVKRLVDKGKYVCIVTNKDNDKVRGEIELQIVVPPKITPFTFQDELIREGARARIQCVVREGDSPISITWFRNGQPISKGQEINIFDVDEFSSILMIRTLSPRHNGNYTCIAANFAGVDRHTTNLFINVPLRWVIEPEDAVINSGQLLLIHCQAEGFPEPSITWKKSPDSDISFKKLQLVDNNNRRQVYGNGTLMFRSIQPSDDGYYVCLATNSNQQTLSKFISIRIQAAPTFQQNKYEIRAKKGDDVVLTCNATGNWPIAYTWFINTQQIDQHSTRYKVLVHQDESTQTSSSTLHITWVDQKDSMQFTCLARNEIGESKHNISLVVQENPDAPIIEEPIKVENQIVKLNWILHYNGNSEITRYVIQYKRDADRWDDRTITLTIPGSMTTVEIPNFKPATTYNFRVMAENIIGNGSFSEVVNARTDETAPEGTAESIEVESIDANTLRVTWKPPKKHLWNGAIRGYNVGYKIHNSSDEFSFTNLEVPDDYTEELIYQLTDLHMYTQYDVIVQAYNSKGKGPISDVVLAMTSEDIPSSPPEEVRCSALSSKSIYVLWDPPTKDSVNGILRGYKVFYKPMEEWYDATIQSKIIDMEKVTIKNLDVNKNYSIQVLAFTKVGDGVKSSPVFCKTHEDVPEPPEAIKVLPSSSDSVVVAWKPPHKSNGALIKYNIYYKPIEDHQKVDFHTQHTQELQKDAIVHSSAINSQSFQITGLKKNKKYAFWVTANSAIGESAGSSIVAQTVADNIVPAKSASFDSVIRTPWQEDVILPCLAVGMPSPNRKWMNGDNVLKETNRLKISSDGSVIITKVDSEDSGNYTCAIYNEHGRDHVTYLVAVQVPPSAPIMDVISKTRTSIKVQWKRGVIAENSIKGYLLHFREINAVWSTKEIRADQVIHNLDNLNCGSTYQIYMEAFNNIGTGTPSDTITVMTDGSEVVSPSKEQIIREGSTFITIHLESWPTNGCPVKTFSVEYKSLTSRDWIVAGTDIKPSKKKLVISNLNPATWYTLRLSAESSSVPTITEYKFATHTITGGTLAPDTFGETLAPVYVFYLDPLIFIPSVALLIVVIIASIVICFYFKRRNGSVGTPSDISDTTTNPGAGTWMRHTHTLPRGQFTHGQHSGHSTFSRSSDPSPYATSHLTDPFHPDHRKLHHGTAAMPLFQHESFQQNARNNFDPSVETKFVFLGNPPDAYDPPPMAHMIRNAN